LNPAETERDYNDYIFLQGCNKLCDQLMDNINSIRKEKQGAPTREVLPSCGKE